jgi:hypothetical protein
LNAAQTPRDESYLAPPSRLRVAVSALVGLWAGAVTAVVVGAYRPEAYVLVVLTAIALLILGARHRSPAMGRPPGRADVASVPAAAAEKITKPPRSLPSLRKSGAALRPKTTSPSSVAEEIAKLGQLLEAGLITEVEFAAQKAKLLEL